MAKNGQKAETDSRIDRTEVAQPALFSLQIGLAALWESYGVRPAAVVGHSIGEAAAAAVSGRLTLEEAVRVVYWRSSLQQRAAGLGRMLAVGLPAAEARKEIAGLADRVDVAAINAPSLVVLSGDAEPLSAQLLDDLQSSHPVAGDQRRRDFRDGAHGHVLG